MILHRECRVGGCFEWHFNTCLRYNSVNWSVAVGNSSSDVLDYYISWDKNILVSFPNFLWVASKNWPVIIRFLSMTAVMWQLPSPSMSVCLFESERQLSNIISGNLRWPRRHKGSCRYTTAMKHQNSASEYVHNNFRTWVIFKKPGCFTVRQKLTTISSMLFARLCLGFWVTLLFSWSWLPVLVLWTYKQQMPDHLGSACTREIQFTR